MRKRSVALSVAAIPLAAVLAGCASTFQPPASGTATLVAHAPDALLADGTMEVLIYPEGCPIERGDQPYVLGRVSPRQNLGRPSVFRVPGGQPVVLQVHFMQGSINCRAHMEVVLNANQRYDLRSELKRIVSDRKDPSNRAVYQPDAQSEVVCAFGIIGVRSTGRVKPDGKGKPEC
ncbi:MAG: hypothetical protein R3200_00915 [Xanthomonadales bacterium]|nr:hypothetical protein [Xanthomonadales bacterium]